MTTQVRNLEDLLELLHEKSTFVRTETVRLIGIAKSGHYTSVFSCAEIFATLYYHAMRYDAKRPMWEDRDRFLMGKGHAAVGWYPILADVGFFGPSLLDDYTRIGSAFGDHPDMVKVPGADFSSGSLGHTLSVSVGMALGGRIQKRDFRVYCLLGDGELNEGQVWEAFMSAGNFGLGNLVAIVDQNTMSLDGTTAEVMDIEPLADKFRAFKWRVAEIDGHDLRQVVRAFDELPPPSDNQPTVILAHTMKGHGLSYMSGSRVWHLGYLAPQDAANAIRQIRREAGYAEDGA